MWPGRVPCETPMRGRVIPVALLALVLPGCRAETQSSRGGEGSPTAVAAVDPAHVTTKIVGATPRQEAVLREILGSLARRSSKRFTSLRRETAGLRSGPTQSSS